MASSRQRLIVFAVGVGVATVATGITVLRGSRAGFVTRALDDWRLSGASARYTPSSLHRVSLADVDPLAVCTDGTPASYYYRLATSNQSTWTIDLEFGGWCWSAEECARRCPKGSKNTLCSSAAFPEVQDWGGVLRPRSVGTFEGGHVAFVKYCSSDGHMGDAEAFGRQFRGRRIVQAVLADLVRRQGLGSGGRELLIFAGQSAGARGAMVHLDYAQSMLREAGVADAERAVDVVGFLDSPLWVDVGPYHPRRETLADQCAGVYTHFNVEHTDPQCLRQHAGESWKCIMGEYRLPYLRTPYFAIASQYDSFQLNTLLGHDPRSRSEVAFANKMQSHTSAVLKSISRRWADDVPRRSVLYSWACFNHATTLGDAGFSSGTVRGMSIRKAFLLFLGHGGSAPAALIEDCHGFGCGAHCP